MNIWNVALFLAFMFWMTGVLPWWIIIPITLVLLGHEIVASRSMTKGSTHDKPVVLEVYCPQHGNQKREPVYTLEGNHVADVCMATTDWGGFCLEQLAVLVRPKPPKLIPLKPPPPPEDLKMQWIRG